MGVGEYVWVRARAWRDHDAKAHSQFLVVFCALVCEPGIALPTGIHVCWSLLLYPDGLIVPVLQLSHVPYQGVAGMAAAVTANGL